MLGAILILPQQVCSMDTEQTTSTNSKNSRTTPNNATDPSSNTDNTFFGIPLKYISCLSSAFFSTNLWSDSSHEQGSSTSNLSTLSSAHKIPHEQDEQGSSTSTLSTLSSAHKIPKEVLKLIFSYLLTEDTMVFGSLSKIHRYKMLERYKNILQMAGMEEVRISFDGIGTDSTGNPSKALPQLYVGNYLWMFDYDCRTRLLEKHTNKINDPFTSAIILTRLGYQELVNFNRSNFTPTALRELAEMDCIEAQSRVAQGLAKGENGFEEKSTKAKQFADHDWPYSFVQENTIKLRILADHDWPAAREHVAMGLAMGMYGFAKDPYELKRRAHGGCEFAQNLVVDGLGGGWYGFSRNHRDLWKLADRWEIAKDYIVEGIILGENGFVQNPTELRRLADKGWLKAKYYIAEGLAKDKYGFAQNSTELKRLADQGWVHAQKLVIEGTIKGMYGFPQDSADLKEISLDSLEWGRHHKRFTQVLIIDAIAEGKYGFVQNPDRLRNLARDNLHRVQKLAAAAEARANAKCRVRFPDRVSLGRDGLQRSVELVAEGLKYGKFGIQKDLVAYREFLAIHHKNTDLFKKELPPLTLNHILHLKSLELGTVDLFTTDKYGH